MNEGMFPSAGLSTIIRFIFQCLYCEMLTSRNSLQNIHLCTAYSRTIELTSLTSFIAPLLTILPKFISGKKLVLNSNSDVRKLYRSSLLRSVGMVKSF